MKTKLMTAVCGLMLVGCGLSGNQVVPKEQVNSDLAGKTIKARSVSGQIDWNFKDDFLRCFSPTPNEGKVTESNADIMLDVSATKYPTDSGTEVMFGKILLHYKKDGGKWTLESIEPKDAATNILEIDKAIEFARSSGSICSYFRYSNDAKK